MRPAFLPLVLNLTALLASAAPPVIEEARQWNGATQVIQDLVFPGEPSRLRLVPPPPGATVEIPLPKGFDRIHVFDGVYYATRWVQFENPTLRRLDLVSSPDARSWQILAELKTEPGEPYLGNPVPIGRDRFLVGSGSRPFSINGRPSGLGIAILHKGRLKLDTVLDMGDTWAKVGQGPFDHNLTILRDEDRIVALAERSGAYWVLSVNPTGTVSLKAGHLLPDLPPAKPQDNRPRAVLLSTVSPEGTVLLATRSQAHLLAGQNASKASAILGNQDRKALMQQLSAQIATQQDAVWKAHGEILWWELAPHATAFKRRPAPEGTPDRVESGAQANRIKVSFNGKGELDVKS